MALTINLDKRLQQLKKISNQEQMVVEALKAFSDCCQVAEAYFFRYSSIGFLGEGIIAIEQGKLRHIPELRYDIRSLPTIQLALAERKAKHYEGQEIFEKTGSNHIIGSTVQSFVVMPLFHGTTVHGFLYGINQQAAADSAFLDELTCFGEQLGRAFQLSSVNGSAVLSNRELEVMKEIAAGRATKEIAALLEISEATVKQYVKQAGLKLGAANRTHAVAILMRRGDVQ